MLSRFILFFILFSSNKANCQSDSVKTKEYKNAFFMEVLGHSESLISANYERFLKPIGNSINYSARLGIGYSPGIHEDNSQKFKGKPPSNYTLLV